MVYNGGHGETNKGSPRSQHRGKAQGQDIAPVEGLDWITALRAPAIQALAQQGVIQLSLFDERDLAEITSPDYPGERLIACRNPLLAAERRRKREELLEATEKELNKIVAATRRNRVRLAGKEQIGLRVGKVLNRYKVGKHFKLRITDEGFEYERDVQKIAAEANLDGIYVIRTSVPVARLSAEDTVRTYKGLSAVERAFRSLKTVDLKVRPFFHRLAERVRGHVLLCMLAYYVEWHMRRSLAPLLFDDEDPEVAESLRASAVSPAMRSPSAQRKAQRKRNDEGLPVHSFQSLLRDLATINQNHLRLKPVSGESGGIPQITTITEPTPCNAALWICSGSPWSCSQTDDTATASFLKLTHICDTCIFTRKLWSKERVFPRFSLLTPFVGPP